MRWSGGNRTGTEYPPAREPACVTSGRDRQRQSATLAAAGDRQAAGIDFVAMGQDFQRADGIGINMADSNMCRGSRMPAVIQPM